MNLYFELRSYGYGFWHTLWIIPILRIEGCYPSKRWWGFKNFLKKLILR